MKESETSRLRPGALLGRRYTADAPLTGDGVCLRYAGTDKRAGRAVELLEFFPEGLAARVEGENTVSPVDAAAGARFFAGANAFHQQARALLPLVGSSNLLCVRDCFFENGTAYAVCDPLSGCTLGEYRTLRGACLTPGEALCVLSAAADGLLVLHSASLLHLGIRAEHIFLCTEGQPRLLGFGAAERALRGEPSPAEAEDDASEDGAAALPCPWTDIRMLGETVYSALTDRAAPAPENVTPASLEPLPEVFRGTLEKMLSGDPRLRFDSLFGLLHELNCIDAPMRRPVVDEALYASYARREAARRAEAEAAARKKRGVRLAILAGTLALAALCVYVLLRLS